MSVYVLCTCVICVCVYACIHVFVNYVSNVSTVWLFMQCVVRLYMYCVYVTYAIYITKVMYVIYATYVMYVM